MPDHFTLDPNADDQKLLAQVVVFYHATLKQNAAALDWLKASGIAHPSVIDHFRLGFADRSLGTKLPLKAIKSGEAIRARLQRLGIFRASGHEHFRGSLTVPVLAADGSGQIADIYGRKVLGTQLRKGTALDTHLNDQRRGVFNVGALAGSQEVVLCASVIDALTFWAHGYRNVTAVFKAGALTDDFLTAFSEFNVRRVLTTDEGAVEKLLTAGLEAFVVRLPVGTDVNGFALQTKDPADALGSLLRGAEWAGKGTPATIPLVPSTPAPDAASEALADLLEADEEEHAVEELDGEDNRDPERPDHVEEQPPLRTASPVPPAPATDEAAVGEHEVVLTFGTRRYRVRGLDRNATPDVLRVNVLATNGVGMFVDTFDLYSAKHRTGFQAQAAAELNVEEGTVKADVGRVLLKLEELQDARLRKDEATVNALPDMPAQERDDALALLRAPDLLDRIVNDSPVVGERANKLIGYLAAVSRKLDQPLAVLIQSTSAAGKTTLMESVLAFVPPEDVVKFSSMTGQSLYYMQPDALRHKILALVEEEGAARASYALKLLQSEGELRIASTGKEGTSGRLVTQEYRVEGPVMLFLTTTSSAVDEELLNRCVVLTVNEDRDQTRAIHRLQRTRHTLAGLLAAQDHARTLKLHRNAQRLLEPLLVANPYAERLTFMDTTPRARRDNQKYLTLIRTIALLRQHQRPVRTAEHAGQPVEYIEVTLDDIETANRLAADIFGRCLDDLPPQTRRLLDLIDDMAGDRCRVQGVERADLRFTRRDVREFTRWGETQLKLHMKRLVELEYLLAHRDRAANRLVYELLYAKPVGADDRALAGLIDVALLRDAERSGSEARRSGSGRSPVGAKPGVGRADETAPLPSNSSREPLGSSEGVGFVNTPSENGDAS